MTLTSQPLPTIATAPDALATRMFELTCGFVYTRLLHTVATLQIADLLTAGPRRIDDLAGEAGVDADALARILRALAAVEVFTEVAPDTFDLTPLGSKLRTDSPNFLMHDMALMCGEEGLYNGVGHLTPAVRKGTVAFHEAHGRSWWEYMKEWPSEERTFNRAMGNLTGEIHAAALAAYDLTGVQHLVDVGGGHGYLVADILQRYPEARATVFDQPHVVPGAQAILDAASVLDRAEVIGGDFLEAVPSGDVYVVSMTLHNWPDTDAIRILTNIRRAMAPGGRVLIIEPVIPQGDTYHFGKILDIVMLAVFGGRERTAAQHAALLQAAGLRYTKTIETGRLTSVVEAMV